MKDNKTKNMKLAVAGGIAAVLGIATIALIKSNNKYELDYDGESDIMDGDVLVETEVEVTED